MKTVFELRNHLLFMQSAKQSSASFPNLYKNIILNYTTWGWIYHYKQIYKKQRKPDVYENILFHFHRCKVTCSVVELEKAALCFSPNVFHCGQIWTTTSLRPPNGNWHEMIVQLCLDSRLVFRQVFQKFKQL